MVGPIRLASPPVALGRRCREHAGLEAQSRVNPSGSSLGSGAHRTIPRTRHPDSRRWTEYWPGMSRESASAFAPERLQPLLPTRWLSRCRSGSFASRNSLLLIRGVACSLSDGRERRFPARFANGCSFHSDQWRGSSGPVFLVLMAQGRLLTTATRSRKNPYPNTCAVDDMPSPIHHASMIVRCSS